MGRYDSFCARKRRDDLTQKDFDPTPQDGLAHVIGDTGQAIWHRTIPDVFKETVGRFADHDVAVFPNKDPLGGRPAARSTP